MNEQRNINGVTTFSQYMRVAFLVSLVSVVTACGSAGNKDTASVEVKPTLAETTQFIPVQKYDDKTSTYLPYEPQENPYLALKGRINKKAVTGYIEARRLYRAKKYDAAAKVLNNVVELDKKISGPLVMLGDIAVQNKQMDKAVEYFEKAITVNAKNINAYVKLAHAKRILGEFLPAQNVYADALAVWPDFPEAHLNLGILYDVYLNHPLRAQKHMEAYQFLTGGGDAKVAAWIGEIQGRTGIKTNFIGDKNSSQVQQ